MEQNRNDQQRTSGEGEGQRPLEKNETLQDAGAAVPDYGRAGQELDEREKEHGIGSGREGNSSIPLDNEDTIGNP